MRETLTGFKWIGDQIANLEADGEVDRFIFGFEESYGYLAGPYVRDKDAVVASMLICEMAAYYRLRGMTLIDAMEEMYQTYGVCLDQTDEAVVENVERKQQIMAGLRSAPPKALGGDPVCEISDYQNGIRRNLRTGEETKLPFEPADVLSFLCESGASVMIRPSGTEPKIKVYTSVPALSRKEAEDRLEAYRSDSANWF
jgi:phosphoglucomutase